MDSFIHALFIAGKNTLLQFGLFFGVFILGGAILTFLSRWTNNIFQRFVYPKFGMYLFGVVGVPVHEFCHAFFCKLFLHEVKDVKWFDPEGKTGSHGAVTHLYNPHNPYHRVGHFFIGLGPVILAPLFLALGFYLLVPGAAGFSAFASTAPTSLAHDFARALFAKSNLASITFYIFLYLAIAISSQMELSSEDLGQAKTGLLPILLILFSVNLIAGLFTHKWHFMVMEVGWRAMLLWSCIFTFAALLALFNLLLCWLLFNLIHKLSGKPTISPF